MKQSLVIRYPFNMSGHGYENAPGNVKTYALAELGLPEDATEDEIYKALWDLEGEDFVWSRVDACVDLLDEEDAQ